MNYTINRSNFKIVQGITNTLEVFIQDVDHQVSMINTSATGSATFTGTTGTDVPAGTIVSTSDGMQFTTQTDFLIGTTTGSVTIQAVSTGPLSYSSGSVLTTTISGVTATLTSAISGGNTATINFNVVDPKYQSQVYASCEGNYPNPYDNSVLLLSRQMVVKDITRSLYTVTFLPSDIIDWDIGDYQYSVTITNSDSTITILYTDLDYSPYGVLTLTYGPFPVPAPVQTFDPSTWNISNYFSYSSPLVGSAQFGYPQGSQTFVFYCTNYTGVVNIYGSLSSNPNPTQMEDWFIITQPYFTNVNGPQQVTVNGNYLWLMVQLPVFQIGFYPNMPNTVPPYVMGSITSVTYKN